MECEISAIWRRFQCILALDRLKVRHIFTSGLFDLLTQKMCDTFHLSRDNFHQIWRGYDHSLPNYTILAADTLRDRVTLTFDLFTLDSVLA